jgi:hypothetical protein
LNHHCGLIRLNSGAFKRLRLRKRFASSPALKALNNVVSIGKTAKFSDFFAGTTPTIQLTFPAFALNHR